MGPLREIVVKICVVGVWQVRERAFSGGCVNRIGLRGRGWKREGRRRVSTDDLGFGEADF